MTDTFVPGSYLTDYDEQADAGQFAQAHELSNRIQFLTQAAPYLADDTEALTAIAQMPIPTEQLGYYAASASAQMRLQGTLEDLQRMEPGRQRQIFAMMTPTQQKALGQMGYQPDTTGDEGGSNPILGAIGKVGAGVMGGVNTLITETPIVSDVFEIMNTLQNGVNTLYRSIRTDDTAQLATAAMIAGGIAAAPFTGGLSLAATAGVIAAGGLAAGSAAAMLTNPSDYIESLHDNWEGEAVFSKSAQRQARTLLANSGLDVMARDIGWEMDPYETVRLFASTPEATSDQAYIGSIDRVLDRIAQPGDPRRAQLADQLVQMMQIPEFRLAVEKLQNSKTSFGRDAARMLGLNPGDTGYSVVSGGLDAAFTIVTDPTLAATGAFKWQRAVRLGVPMRRGEDFFETVNAIADRANTVPSIGRAYDEIAHAVETDAPHILWRRVPDAKGMFDDLRQYKQLLVDEGKTDAFTRDDIFDWLHDTEHYESMLAGYGVKQGFGRLLLPTYGWSVPMTKYLGMDDVVVMPGKLLEGAKAAIDFADDNANAAHIRKIAKQAEKLDPAHTAPSLNVVDRIEGAVARTPTMDEEWNTLRKWVDVADRIPIVRQIERSSGALLNSLIEMMPATNSISMVGPQAFEDIQRMTGLGRLMGMSSHNRKMWFDTIMQQDNVEHRINAALSYMDTLLSAGGMRDSARGKELADQFISKVKHRYSLGEADEFIFGERVTSRALHPYQHTFDLPVPSLKELRQYAQKGMIWKYALRATDVELVDTAMNKVWKPLVLLRIGFITRAGGEELLALMARAGPSQLIGEFGARSIAEGRMHSAFLESAEAMEGITAVQRRAIERMRYVAHVRPLERMFHSWDWSRPAVRVLGKYSDFVRTGLERGLLPGIDMAVPESRRLALIGKSGGFRNAILTGVDQDMIRYAESFARVHSTSIMRELSSANASVAHDLTSKVQDPNDFSLRFIDPAGELQDLGFVAERGHFKIYRKGDPFFDRMAHGQTAQILNDELTGPAYVHVTSRWAPDSMSDEAIAELLVDARRVQDYRLQAILRELLTGNDWRTSNWEGSLRGLQHADEDFGTWMRGAHGQVGEELTDHNAVLDTIDQWIAHRFPGSGTRQLTSYGLELRDQNAAARALIAKLSALNPNERAWAGQFVDLWGRVPDQPQLLRSFEEYKRELTLRLNDRHYDPANQQLVSSLTYANRTSDGSAVAAAPLEGRTRIFIPQMQAEAYGRMIAQLWTGGPEQFVNNMTQLWAQSASQFSGLHMEQMDEILGRFLNQIAFIHPNQLMRHSMDVGAFGKTGALVPLTFLGVDDPDVAARLSQFMNASLSGTGKMTMAQRFEQTPYGQVGLLDLDDRLRNYNPMDVDGAKRPIAHQAHDHRIQVIEPERTIQVETPVFAPGTAAVPPFGGSADAIVATEYESFIRQQAARQGAIQTDPVTGATGTPDPRPTPIPATIPATPPRQVGVTTTTDTIPAVYGSARDTPRLTDRTIHSWALDPEYLTPRVVSLADQPIVTLPDGTRAIGADPRVAIGEGVDKAVTDWMQHVASGGGQQRIVKGVAYRDPHARTAVAPGTRIHMRDELYNARGDIIEYDDPTVYSLLDIAPGENIHENWTMIGPLIRDATDHMFGTGVILPDTRHIDNVPAHVLARRAEEAPRAGEPGMRQFRGHYSHVSDLDNPPMVALGPALKPVFAPSRWDKALTFGFERVISPAIDAIVRRPLAFHMYAEAMQENERALRWGLSTHLFGDDSGATGALHDRFGKLLDDPAAQIDVAATADAIRIAVPLLMPDLARSLDGLDDMETVSALFGNFADDVLLHGNLTQQAKAARDTISGVLRDEITMHWRTPRTNATVTQLFEQTRTAPAKRVFQLGDGRWTARQATTVGQNYLDVPADRLSSVLADLNGTNRKARQAVFDTHGAAKMWVRGTPPPTVGGPEWERVVDAAYNWAVTGKQPRLFAGVHSVYGARLETDMRDLVARLQVSTRYGGSNINEWADAIKASEFVATQPRWALPRYTNQRPIEGILDAYQEQLGDLLARNWGEQTVKNAVAQLPQPLREALDKNAWSVLSSSYKARARMMDTVENLAAQRAINNSIPYLDSHEIRSQAGDYVRGFFPFMYAEQNFLKRWARTLRVAPDALRKGQLAYHGLQHLGVIRTDSQGRDWYVYPGAGLLAETVNRAVQATGAGEVLPTGVVFASNTQSMLPGFSEQQVGMASANPLVAIPMGWVASHFHELRPLQESIVGQQGVTQGGLTQFIPSTIRRLWTVAGNENSNVQYASAMMSAIAVLEHNGHGLPDDATKNQLDDFIRRVRQHTRAILATQAFVGFITPGSPSIEYTGDGALDTSSLTGLGVEIPADVFRSEYIELVQELGIEQGTMRYFEINPDHTVEDLMAYTVGQSTSVSGAPLPATHEAVTFADEHQGWIEQYPMAAAWMLPQPKGGSDEQFDEYAYVQQAISGMRQRRTPTEFLEALKFREGSLDYFKGRDKQDQLMADASEDPARRKVLQDAWDEWSTMHKAMHPIFAEQLEGGESRERRARVLDEVRTAISDPATPHVAHLAGMSELMQTFDIYQSQHAAMSESRTQDDIAKVARLETIFQNLVTQFLWDHPELQPFWLSVLRPEASL